MATSVWKGHLTFGLVSFPIRLFSAARSETISFNLLHKTDHSRIKQVTYCQAEDKPIPRSDLSRATSTRRITTWSSTTRTSRKLRRKPPR